jgi:hypothetical protein
LHEAGSVYVALSANEGSIRCANRVRILRDDESCFGGVHLAEAMRDDVVDETRDRPGGDARVIGARGRHLFQLPLNELVPRTVVRQSQELPAVISEPSVIATS